MNISERDIKRVLGGVLVQDRDMDLEDRTEMEVVTERKPSEREWGEMLFAWKVCKHVRSNAIVLARDLASVGIGAGQMSRVDSVRIAIEKAAATETDLTGGALASDAFFPFSDGPQLAVDAGVTAIIQPGGSKRDHEVVEAADAAGISMVFTHRRHFRTEPPVGARMDHVATVARALGIGRIAIGAGLLAAAPRDRRRLARRAGRAARRSARGRLARRARHGARRRDGVGARRPQARRARRGCSPPRRATSPTSSRAPRTARA